MAYVDFFYTYGCPWTYLASVRLRETVLRTAARIVWKPILIERVHGRAPAHGSATSPTEDARTRYARKDLADWATFCGVTIRRPPPYPAAAGRALTGAVLAIDKGVIAPYSERAFAACFAEAADLDSPEVVADIAAAAGIERHEFVRRAGEPALLKALEENTAELVRRGGFGSPTMFVGEDMYFGNDRMPLVEFALNRCSDQPIVAPGAHGQS